MIYHFGLFPFSHEVVYLYVKRMTAKVQGLFCSFVKYCTP